ncbi:MAG: hypothetical protein IH587_00250 [Anaerolineae bacterium]|nr:hypothetical protein [Anaerolineae bacterium]
MRRKGMSISAIARQTGRDRKTIRKIITTGVQRPAPAVFHVKCDSAMALANWEGVSIPSER